MGNQRLILLFVVCATNAIDNNLFPRSRMTSASVCDSPVCKARAELILASINSSTDPCDDFYAYVCNGWKDAHPIPEDSPFANSFVEITLNVKQDLREILENLPVVPEAKTAREKAAVAYQACIRSGNDEIESLSAVRRLLESNGLGQWPILDGEDIDDLGKLEDVIKTTGLPSLFAVDVAKDMDDLTRHILQLGQKRDNSLESLTRGSMNLASTLADAFLGVTKTAARLLRPNATDEQLDTYANKTLSFMAELRAVQQPPEETRQARNNYRKATIEEFQREIFGLDLLKVIGNEFAKVNITIPKEEKIVVNAIQHVNATVQVYLQADLDTVYNYVGFTKVTELLQLASKDFAALVARMLQMAMGVHETARWKQCVRHVERIMTDTVGRLYTEHRLTKEAKNEGQRLVREIGLSYYDRLQHIDWMDSQTRRKAREKLWKMTSRVAYPETFLNDEYINSKYHEVGIISKDEDFLEISNKFQQANYARMLRRLRQPVPNRDEWSVGAAEDANAYYSPETNEIIIPGGILREPFFQEGLPEYVNLGAIGSIIGHEITHGYDDQGSQYDGEGRLVDWWSNKTEQKFNEKKECFIKQYGSMVNPVTNETVHGENTVGENIADNGGVRVAFATYQRISESTGEQIIPGLENFSPEQIFFISYALVWCSSERTEANSIIMGDVHSPSNYRVNIPLRNFEEFSSAFDCGQGTSMHSPPQEKCVLW
ncbi:neprilysin-1-like [Dermacentor albipictus]|uniref:neprilysin-1-like n=1 Tax=Dermacentor albipictus TaxID=60249 RepID=UPI0031FC789A